MMDKMEKYFAQYVVKKLNMERIVSGILLGRNSIYVLIVSLELVEKNGYK
jgi:hypothetical protein